MIVLTRLNRTRFAVNPDLIERIQATPDTTLVMVDGATFVVAETMDAVIDAVVAFRSRVLTSALHGDHTTSAATATTVADTHATVADTHAPAPTGPTATATATATANAAAPTTTEGGDD
ncbi:flagellar FlbD family protein [Microbacterium sp. LjRoot45]|uniref:flagellar FlbD family protein n=1 Tax=Microbacterium sp. LjRoot45 TaxID=3342329 RepID=UPI003ED03DD8